MSFSVDEHARHCCRTPALWHTRIGADQWPAPAMFNRASSVVPGGRHRAPSTTAVIPRSRVLYSSRPGRGRLLPAAFVLSRKLRCHRGNALHGQRQGQLLLTSAAQAAEPGRVVQVHHAMLSLNHSAPGSASPGTASPRRRRRARPRRAWWRCCTAAPPGRTSSPSAPPPRTWR